MMVRLSYISIHAISHQALEDMIEVSFEEAYAATPVSPDESLEERSFVLQWVNGAIGTSVAGLKFRLITDSGQCICAAGQRDSHDGH
jgi:hypothetical protein